MKAELKSHTETTGISITFNRYEAEMLKAVCMCVGGHPTESPRFIFDTLYQELCKFVPTTDEAPLDTLFEPGYQSLYFYAT